LKSWALRYGLAIATVGVALLITNSLEHYTDITPLFYAAIVVSAWFGGMGPGLLAVVLAEISIDYFFVEPLYTLDLAPKHISFLIVFGVLAVLTSWMSAKRKHAESGLREARDQLELRVQQRTAELQETNEALQLELSERRRAEDALRQTQTELTHVTRVMTIGELTASLAHEINQPLAAIVTNGNAALRWLRAHRPNFEEASSAIDRIIKDSYRASAIISRIRSLVKKTAPRNEAVDLDEVIREVLALAESEARRNRVTLRRDIAGELPSVSGDRVQLQQVILNLVVNGLEAISKSDDHTRELSVASRPQSDGSVLVVVRDSGIGLDPANAPHVFDAFFTTKADGMGMGLAISRTIIEAHGGRLWAEPNSPQGAVFQFTLPTKSEANDDRA
jgi:C4-dicarboxylate-specific signal transduction histidine kinase